VANLVAPAAMSDSLATATFAGVGISAVPDTPVAEDASFNSDGTFSASGFDTVTGAQIVAASGPRKGQVADVTYSAR
jgi:hypothetical protein